MPSSYNVCMSPFGKVRHLFKLLSIVFFVSGIVLWSVFTPNVIEQPTPKTDRYREILNTEEYLKKRLAMEKVFVRYGSPFVEEIDSFLFACLEYDLDCYLLPAISGVESGFGRALLPGSHNPFGWGGGYIYFNSWREGFLAVAKGLRENYINRGLTSPELIGPVYAPPSKTWAGKVNYFMNIFREEEKKTIIKIIRL